MSVDFYPAIVTQGDALNPATTRPAIRCACELLEELNEPHPTLCAACTMRLNLSNVNACDLLVYLGLEPEPCGKVRADKLTELIRTRLAQPNLEPARPVRTVGRVTECGRDADYLPHKARELLVIAAYARGGWVVWS